MTTPSTEEQSSSFADQASDAAGAAMRTGRQKANDALDGLSDTMQNVKQQAAAAMERLRPQIDTVASYAKEEPTKALLIAAAAGAGLVGLISLLGRSSGSSMPSTRELRRNAADAADSWRKAALDKADSWRKAVSSARDDAGSAADDATSSLKSAVNGAAKSAYSGLADTMAQWKDQATPLVDKLRPQIDAVTTYAKDDPAKALLVAAVAGAALMGLMSAINR